MSRATGFNMENASDFKLLDRKAVESVLSMPERRRVFQATSSWVGFKSTSVLFEVQEQEAGESKWSTGSLIRYAFRNIVAFTTLPLQFVTIGAGGCFICSLLLLIYSLVRYFTGRTVGLHDFADRDAVYRQCGDDEPWNYRILYCKDL